MYVVCTKSSNSINGNRIKGVLKIKIKGRTLIIAIAVLLLGTVFVIKTVLDRNDVVATIDKVNIKADSYRYALLIAKEKAIEKYDDMNEEDIWNYRETSVSPTYADELEKYEMDKLIRTALINKHFDELDLEFTDSQNDIREKNVEEKIQEYGGMKKAEEYFARHYITYDDFVGFYEDYDRYELLFLYYFGVQGIQPVSEKAIDDYYAKNNARVKSILIPTVDSSGNVLSENKLKKAKELVKKIEKKALTSKKDCFDELIDLYNEDVGVESNPYGYVITKDYDKIEGYREAAFAMNEGEVEVIETDNGYYIMKKYSVTDATVYSDYLRRQALFDMKGDEFEQIIYGIEEQSKVKLNKKTIDNIHIETITQSIE